MSDTRHDRSRLLAYAVQILQLDPEQDAETIIAARISTLCLNEPALDPEPDIAAIRQARQIAIENLHRVRQTLWTLPIEELDAQLIQLANSDAPDLQTAISRLQVVARHRQAFLELVTNKAEETFESMLKDVFVLGPRETVALKEAIRQAFRRPFWRRARRHFVLRLRDRLPELYQLEADWFALILGQQPGLIPPRRKDMPARLLNLSSQATSRSVPWWQILLFIVIVRVLSGILFRQ